MQAAPPVVKSIDQWYAHLNEPRLARTHKNVQAPALVKGIPTMCRNLARGHPKRFTTNANQLFQLQHVTTTKKYPVPPMLSYMLSMLLRNSWSPTFRIFQGGHQTTVPRHPRGPPAPHPKSPVVESSRGWRLRSSCLGHTPGYFDFGEKYENSWQAKSKQWVCILKPGSIVKFRQNTSNLTRIY